MSPSMAVVRNTLLPHTTGDECPRPATGVFHLIFFVAVHSVGKFFSVEIPMPPGPRHCGQFVVAALLIVALRTATMSTEMIADEPIRMNVFIVYFLQRM